MGRIDKRFKELKKKHKKAFIVYICAGDPDINTTESLVKTLDNCGVDIIELGMPFSDPLADGPTIQAASQRALKKGINIAKIFALVKRIRRITQMPIVLMGYYNPVFNYGLRRFIKDATLAGVDGAIIADLPVEEASEFIKLSIKLKFDTIFLTSPTTTNKKFKEISKKSRGFIYYVSLTGVTGVRDKLPAKIKTDVKTIKRYTKKPVCVGFGISKLSQIKNISAFADGIIVGSAIIKRIEVNLGNRKKILSSVTKLVNNLRSGIR